MMGLHASFTLSPETLDYVKAHNEDKLGYHVHVAEGPEDVADVRKIWHDTCETTCRGRNFRS